jgi:hypothetical protein
MRDAHEHRSRDSHADDAVDDLIRRRFRSCETLPLFVDDRQPVPPGFFQPPHTGEQLRLDVRPPMR